MANDEVIGPRKTMFVLVIVVGCFAVLWPRILSPLVLGPSREQMQPNQFDREAGCCEVIFETDVAILELVDEVCSSSLGVGRLSPQSAAECRKAINDTCGVDIAVFLKRNENVGKTTKMLVETMQNSNSSCLREHFGVPVYSLGPHLASKTWDIKDTLKQERAPPMRGMGPHPALRERGRAIPPGPPGPPPPPASKPIALPPHVRVRSPLSVYYEVEQPPPIPGMRPPLGSPGGPVPAPKSSMGFVMPIYTICIIVFFVYTLSKILFRRTASPYDPVAPDPQFRRRVFRDDSRSSPDKLGKKEADTIVTAISGLVAEVQQQMEASNAQNQQRQDVQDNARPYTNGTILLNSGPVQIVASEYKEAKEKTPEPLEKESTEPKESETTKVAKEPSPEHDVVAPECNEPVEPKELEVSKPSPEPVEQKEATHETVVEESPESLQTKEHEQPSPEPEEPSPVPLDKDPSSEIISQLAEASKESNIIEPSVTDSVPSDLKETITSLEQSIPVPEVVKESPKLTSQDIQGSLDLNESVDTLPEEHSTQPKDISPEPSSGPEQPSPEPKEPSPEAEEPIELVLEPKESTPEPKESDLELKKSVSEPDQSIPETSVPQTQALVQEPKEVSPESQELETQLQEPSPEPKESLTLEEELLESNSKPKKSNEFDVILAETEEHNVPKLLSDAIEPILDPKLEVSTAEISESLSEIDAAILEHTSPTADTTDSILEYTEPTHKEPTPGLTKHIEEVDAPEVERSTEPLDTSTLKEPTPQSKPSTPKPEGTVEVTPTQAENAALIDLEEAIAELDDAAADVKISEKSTLNQESTAKLGEAKKPQISEEALQHLDESIAELDDATAKLQEKPQSDEKESPDHIEADDEVNAEVLKVFEDSDALEESPKQTTDKFLKNERFTVTKRTTPEHIEDMKGKPIELLTPTETPAAFKVLGMETTAHPVDNSAWPRDLPAPPSPVPHRAPHSAEEVQSIFLETEIPQQSRVLVAQFEEGREQSDEPQSTKRAPLVVSGKMTLSLIQDAPRETPERDPESTFDEFTTASAVTQPAAEKGEIESDEEIDEEIEVEEIEEEIEEEEEVEEPPSPNPATKK